MSFETKTRTSKTKNTQKLLRGTLRDSIEALQHNSKHDAVIQDPVNLKPQAALLKSKSEPKPRVTLDLHARAHATEPRKPRVRLSFANVEAEHARLSDGGSTLQQARAESKRV